MSDESILFSQNDGIVRITLNRPKVRNAFDPTLIEKLTCLLKKISIDPKVRVLELRGQGKVFCAGADLNWMQDVANYSYEENLADAETLAELMITLNQLRCPTIAAVQGAAYGGGLGLIACCDFAIATQSTQFCLSEVTLGLIPAVISPFVLAKIGQKAMRRYALTAEIFDAKRAMEINLIDEVVEEDQLESKISSFTQLLLKNAPEALFEMKKLLQIISTPIPFKDIRTAVVSAIAKRRISAEGQEGLKAFLEKRKPNWK